MSVNHKKHSNLERFIWKEYVNLSHDDKKLSGALEEDDFLYWAGVGKDCVQSILKEIGEIPIHLANANEKSRKKILKTLAKEYVRMYIGR